MFGVSVFDYLTKNGLFPFFHPCCVKLYQLPQIFTGFNILHICSKISQVHWEFYRDTTDVRKMSISQHNNLSASNNSCINSPIKFWLTLLSCSSWPLRWSKCAHMWLSLENISVAFWDGFRKGPDEALETTFLKSSARCENMVFKALDANGRRRSTTLRACFKRGTRPSPKVLIWKQTKWKHYQLRCDKN